ncbi:MAG: FHA domain-containing protein [Prevotella sp.]|nr:FHA domain-containing protein [Prevotella sp.]
MIEKLYIKCPSCGVILDVKNSHHEAVKRISCPNCKKQLDVDFREKPTEPAITSVALPHLYYNQMAITLQEGSNRIPIPDCEHLELKLVLLQDGSCKCIVSPLSAEHPVWINGEQMELEDKTVLSVGDEIRIGDTSLVYEKAAKETVPDEPTIPAPPKRKARLINYGWLMGGATLAIAIILALVLWPKGDQEPVTEPILAVDPNVEPPIGNVDESETEDTDGGSKKQQKKDIIKNNEKKEEKIPSVKDMNLVELELAANNDNNIEAQYELGRRKINSADSASIVLGINYLKKAISNGSAAAQQELERTRQKLQQGAANGNTAYQYILDHHL